MDNTQNNQPDQWQIALDKELQKLQECQKNKGFDTCSKCSEVFSCQIKKDYVLAVYESMNKGSGGGFEF